MEGIGLPAAGPTQHGQAASAANHAQSVAEIPTDLREVIQLAVTLRKRWVQVAAVRGRRGEQLTPEQLAGLEEFFRLARAVVMTPELRDAARFDAAVQAVVNPAHKFPKPYVTQTRELLDAWTASHWGGPSPDEQAEEEEEEGGEEEEGQQAMSVALPTGPAQQLPPLRIRRPNPAHPIYGAHGIMRGIFVARGQRGRMYHFDPAYRQRSAAVIGHNGLAVGQWWPLQRAAQRDGAHGHAQAGIHCRADVGAYSVVVSGAYADIDQDLGDRIYYSGSGSHGHSEQQPVITAGTAALQRSQATRNPVRVLRAASSHTRAPVVGIRYDGLYTVESQHIQYNANSGAYIQFCLERLPGQPPIDRHRPNLAEREQYRRLSEGY